MMNNLISMILSGDVRASLGFGPHNCWLPWRLIVSTQCTYVESLILSSSVTTRAMSHDELQTFERLSKAYLKDSSPEAITRSGTLYEIGMSIARGDI